ncbi:MAG: hypothetical protein CMI98_01555 [Pelagibacteraceae bacterium]|nr:hypothetical protein [Pelagibacteraceae bacterium]|tara:strand:+ start:4374 stop:4805 length:432 start_codon:yes stop_codon:yes gene_type:complete
MVYLKNKFSLLLVLCVSFFIASGVLAKGNLATQTTTLELDMKGDLSLTPKEFNLETGKYYKWIIRSDGIEEMMIQAPDIFRNVWIGQIVINDLEIHGANLIYGIEFDDEGEVEIFLVPIRTGKFEYYVKGYKERGMVGTFNVE